MAAARHRDAVPAPAATGPPPPLLLSKAPRFPCGWGQINLHEAVLEIPAGMEGVLFIQNNMQQQQKVLQSMLSRTC